VISFASPSSYSLTEGTSREIVVMRTLGTANTVSVRLRSVPGTATPGVDYTALNQILTFDAGEAIKKATFTTIDDDSYNPAVALTMELLDASGTSITGGATRNVDISTNDPLPSIAFGNVPASVAEQNAPWTLNVPVTLTGKTRVASTANYTILRNGAAPVTGQVTFTPGQTTATIPVTVPGNTTPEPNYEINIILSSGTSAAIGMPSAAPITVTNDDVVGSLSVADVSVPETDAAGSSAMFHIALAQPMLQEVRVSYATSNLDATAGSDYVAKSGVAVFPPGQTSMLIHVEILGDTVPEPDEKFRFTLSDPVGAIITRAVAEGTIRDDDTSGAAPMLSVSATTVIEKTGSNSEAAFRITLTPAQAQEVRVSYATADGTANAGSDYTNTSGVMTFAPGETSKVVVVPVIGDSVIEPNETFALLLSAPIGAGITAPGRAEITIIDDDLPQITSGDLSVSENAGVAVLTLRITPPVNRAAGVSWATANGTATAGQDYVAASGSATFADSQSIIIEILQDAALESSETFYVDFTSVTNATLERQRVAITIIDDDRQVSARVAVSDTSVIEATGSEVTATFQVTLASPVSSEVRVSYATSDLTALSGADYIPASGTLVFEPGQTSATVAVTVFGDAIAEADEKFRLTLSNPVNATIARSPAEATIQDDDSGPRPSLSILPVKVIEGTGANTDAVFLVTLSAASNAEVRVDFATANGNALEGVDYVAKSGTVSFAPGELTKTIVVPVVGDSIAEPEERFSVALTNASGALIAIPSAVGTIVDDDVTRFRSVRH
jgi:chitinase